MAKAPIRAKHYVVTDYWAEYYVEKNFCSLCGNSGIIDTTGLKMPYGGLVVGRKNYCICPNGQKMRKFKCSMEVRR